MIFCLSHHSDGGNSRSIPWMSCLGNPESLFETRILLQIPLSGCEDFRSTRGCVGRDHDAGGRSPGCDEPESGECTSVGEEAAPRSQNQRVNQEHGDYLIT